MIKYIDIYDLIFYGSDCANYTSKPNAPYLTLLEDSTKNAFRGQCEFRYKGRTICEEMMRYPQWDIDRREASIGLYLKAQRWAIQNIQLFI